MLIDLHTHTRPLSHDSLITGDDLIVAAKERGLDAVCLTEHDFFWDVAEARALSIRHDFTVIPGVELNTEDGHFVAFGLDKWVYGMHRTSELAALIGEASGALIAAHPYRRQLPFELRTEGNWSDAMERATANPAYAHVSAMETFNGRGSERENAFAADLCKRLALRRVAASDSHELTDIGTCATEFSRQISTVEDLVSELRAGRFEPVVMHSGERRVQ
ncbi:MAG: PHP-associated domain-containing protein [Dehalococcoidia bacterium]